MAVSDYRVRGTGRGSDAAEPLDPIVEAANAAAAPSGYEVIDGVNYVWHRRADVDRMGSYASIPSATQFERDGKIYVAESEWVKAHPRKDGWADKLWMLPMAALGSVVAGAATAGGATAAAPTAASTALPAAAPTASTAFGGYTSAAAADMAGLAQMAAAAEVVNPMTMAEFIASGGTLGSTAAGGGGIGAGATAAASIFPGSTLQTIPAGASVAPSLLPNTPPTPPKDLLDIGKSVIPAVAALAPLLSVAKAPSGPAATAPTQPDVPKPPASQAAKLPQQNVFKRMLGLINDPTALTGAGGIPKEKLKLGKSTVLGA